MIGGWQIFWCGILLMGAGVANVFMDLSAEDRFNGWWRFSKEWLNKTTGSAFKYKDGIKENGPKFPESTTALVFLTDGLHLFQFIFHTLWQLALAVLTPHPIIAFIIAKILFSGSFHWVYDPFKDYLIKKRKEDSGK
jgi:hypothetical protein